MTYHRKKGLWSEDIAKAYLSGKTIVEVAKEFGCTGPTVFYHLKKMNTPRRKSGASPQRPGNVLVRAYLAGLGVKDIAELTNINTYTVRYRLKKAGVKMRPVGRPRTVSLQKQQEVSS